MYLFAKENKKEINVTCYEISDLPNFGIRNNVMNLNEFKLGIAADMPQLILSYYHQYCTLKHADIKLFFNFT